MAESKKWIVPALLVAAFCSLLVIVGYLFLAPRRPESVVTFTYQDENRQLRQEKSIQVDGGSVTVSLVGEGFQICGLLLRDIWPYIEVVIEGVEMRHYDFEVDVDKVIVTDSEGHRFKVVAAWPDQGRGKGRRYRVYLDAVEFNRHVKYQPDGGWTRRPEGRGWEPHERYTLGLHFPFSIKGKDHVIDIPRIVGFPTEAFLKGRQATFGPHPPKIQWDDREGQPVFLDGIPVDANASVPFLAKALKDKDGVVRLAAVEALAEMGPKAKEVLPVLLETRRHDENEVIRSEAASALAKIAAEDWPEVEREWKEKQDKKNQ